MKSNGVMTRIIFGILTFTVLSEWHLSRAEISDDGSHLTPVWIVGTDTKNCTLISMDTVIQHPVFKDVKSLIPASAEVVDGKVSECDPDAQTITLGWTDDGYEWEISLLFEVSNDSESYALTKFSGNVTDEEGLSRSWSYREYSYPSAPTMNSIECNFLILLGGRFENITWQPFAQNTDGDFGPGTQCEILETSGGVKFLFFIILTATVAAALVISLFNSPKRK